MWIDSPGRLADIYVFAWHGRDDDCANHTDPGQWLFFAVAERDLPKNQKSIGLGRLKGNRHAMRRSRPAGRGRNDVLTGARAQGRPKAPAA